MKNVLKVLFDCFCLLIGGAGTLNLMMGKPWGFALMFGCFFIWWCVTNYKDETAKTKLDSILGKVLFAGILILFSLFSIIAIMFLSKEGVI